MTPRTASRNRAARPVAAEMAARGLMRQAKVQPHHKEGKMTQRDEQYWARRYAWELRALARVREIFPDAQIDDTDSPFYTEIIDNGTAYVHGVGGAYPFEIPRAVEPWTE